MTIVEIRYAAGRTINTGNFESTRVDISATVRLADDDDESGEQAYESVREFVETRLAQEEARITV